MAANHPFRLTAPPGCECGAKGSVVMSLAFLALSVLVVGACDWPQQDYAAPAAPIMLMDCSAEEQSAA